MSNVQPLFGPLTSAYFLFEKIIYDQMFRFFIENELVSSNQSDFKPGDSGINQLLSIIHEIYQLFDKCYQIRRVFSIYLRPLVN